MKDSIPENAKNALYDVESVNEAWKILDKRYGNKKLICQKLRSKLKRLKPVNTEPKEILIEINEEVKNLVNNIEEFGEGEVLKVDPIYLDVIYMNLHERHQMMWDQHKVDGCEWTELLNFLEARYKVALGGRFYEETTKVDVTESQNEAKIEK